MTVSPLADWGLGEAPGCITLPSSDAALRLVRGEVGGLVGSIGSTLFRALLISGGLAAVGSRDHLVRDSLGAACAIELFVVGWVAAKNASK